MKAPQLTGPSIFCVIVFITFGFCSSSTADANVSLHLSPESLVAEVGSMVTFNCSVDGVLPPRASIKWYKAQCNDGTDALVSNDTIELSDGTLQLVLGSVQLEDSKPGYYSCCVVSEDGRCNHEMEEHVRLRVGYPPEKVQGLECFSHSIYYGHCVWNNTATNTNLETSYSLNRSFHNRDEWTKVNCKDRPPPTDVVADHRCSFGGDDKNYKYRVVSVNALGENTSKTTAALNVRHDAVPYDPPTDVILTPTSTRKMDIEWTALGSLGSLPPIYRLRYNTSMKQEWILYPKELRNANAKLGDLHPPYANVCVQVSARNIGQTPKKWGLWSDVKCARLLEDIPAEGPRFIRQEPEENEEDGKNLKDVTLIWEDIPESKRNGKTLGYNITVKGFLGGVYEDRWEHYLSANETQYRLEGLNRTFEYEVSLTANILEGKSPITFTTIVANPCSEVPAEGPSIREETEENEKDGKHLKDVTLIWEPIPKSKICGKILGYNITVKGFLEGLNGDSWEYYLSAKETWYKLEGLNRTYEYDVSLTANNSMGKSPMTNITIEANPDAKKLSEFVTILIILIITAVVLVVFCNLVYCSWKKLNKERFPDPKIPDIVTQSNTCNANYVKFHTQEPEQFDSPLLRHDTQDEQNTAQTAAVLLLAGAGQTQYKYSNSGSYCSGKSDHVICKRLTPEGPSPIDPQWCSTDGKPTFTRGDTDDDVIYKRMTPQGLSPIDKDTVDQTNESASKSDDVSTYLKSAVNKDQDFNITENPLAIKQCEGQQHISGYVSAQNLRNQQGSHCDSSDSVPSCCVSSGNKNITESRDSRSSTCSSTDSKCVALADKNDAEFCINKQLDCAHTTELDMESSGTNCLHISPDRTSCNESGYVDNCIKLGHVNEPSVSVTVSSSGLSSLNSSNKHLFANQNSIPLLPCVTTDFNSNLTPPDILPKLPCYDGYTPVSAVMQVCRVPSPKIIDEESRSNPLSSPLATSDDGYSSHGNNTPPDSPNLSRSDTNVQEEPSTIECVYPQSQAVLNTTSEYISVSAL